MAIVSFAFGMFLQDAGDLEDYIAVGRRDPSFTAVPQGSVQMTSSGRRRWTSRPGVEETYNVTVRTRIPADRLWIEEHRGSPVLYRDKRSRVVTGVITNTQVSDLTGGIADVAITLEPIDT